MWQLKPRSVGAADASLFGIRYAFVGKPLRLSQMFWIRHGVNVFSHPMIEKL
jgi:hypothetical protein